MEAGEGGGKGKRMFCVCVLQGGGGGEREGGPLPSTLGEEAGNWRQSPAPAHPAPAARAQSHAQTRKLQVFRGKTNTQTCPFQKEIGAPPTQGLWGCSGLSVRPAPLIFPLKPSSPCDGRRKRG